MSWRSYGAEAITDKNGNRVYKLFDVTIRHEILNLSLLKGDTFHMLNIYQPLLALTGTPGGIPLPSLHKLPVARTEAFISKGATLFANDNHVLTQIITLKCLWFRLQK